jgi:hypothetical protein
MRACVQGMQTKSGDRDGAASDANGLMKTEECEQPGLNRIQGSKGKAKRAWITAHYTIGRYQRIELSTVVFIQQCDWWYIAQCTPGLLCIQRCVKGCYTRTVYLVFLLEKFNPCSRKVLQNLSCEATSAVYKKLTG